MAGLRFLELASLLPSVNRPWGQKERLVCQNEPLVRKEWTEFRSFVMEENRVFLSLWTK